MAIVMSWSKCEIKIGETGANDAVAASRTSIGTILDKSSSLAAEDGDKLECKSTGGELVGYEQQSGTLTFTTTVIEPDSTLYAALGIGTADTNDIKVNSHVVEKEFTLEVIPKNVGAYGIFAPKCSVSVKPSWSEDAGHTLVLTFGILKSTVANTFWYKKVKKAASE